MSAFNNSYPVRESLFVKARPVNSPFARIYFPHPGANISAVSLNILVRNIGTDTMTFKVQSTNRTEQALSTTDAFGGTGEFADEGGVYTVVGGGETHIALELKRKNMVQFVTTATGTESATLLFQGECSQDPVFLLVQEPDTYREELGTTTYDSATPVVDVDFPSDTTTLPFGAWSVSTSFYGSTNNIHTSTYSGSSGNVIATLTMSYASGGAADDDNLISVVQS